jgi:hypothetical protein
LRHPNHKSLHSVIHQTSFSLSVRWPRVLTASTSPDLPSHSPIHILGYGSLLNLNSSTYRPQLEVSPLSLIDRKTFQNTGLVQVIQCQNSSLFQNKKQSSGSSRRLSKFGEGDRTDASCDLFSCRRDLFDYAFLQLPAYYGAPVASHTPRVQAALHRKPQITGTASLVPGTGISSPSSRVWLRIHRSLRADRLR